MYAKMYFNEVKDKWHIFGADGRKWDIVDTDGEYALIQRKEWGEFRGAVWSNVWNDDCRESKLKGYFFECEDNEERELPLHQGDLTTYKFNRKSGWLKVT